MQNPARKKKKKQEHTMRSLQSMTGRSKAINEPEVLAVAAVAMTTILAYRRTAVIWKFPMR